MTKIQRIKGIIGACVLGIVFFSLLGALIYLLYAIGGAGIALGALAAGCIIGVGLHWVEEYF